MSRSTEVSSNDRFGLRRLACCLIVVAFATSAAQAEPAGPAYWLDFGKPVRLCPGARDPVPAKIEGSSWGVLAGGALLCQDGGESYTLTVEYLNVALDPDGRGSLKRDTLSFDWVGLSLYRPARQGGGVEWLFDAALPIKGSLKRDANGRIVFGHLTFRVPKAVGRQATNMLLYITFGGPLVALHVV